MPKKRYIYKREVKKASPVYPKEEYYERKHENYNQRDKENDGHEVQELSHLVTTHDPLLSCLKIETEEPVLSIDSSSFEFTQELEVPPKIEKFEETECIAIKSEIHEENESDNFDESFEVDNKTDLNILIEWALNLQYDHSHVCKGRLYPSKEIFEEFSCKIIVLNCTLCKKKMLHTLKDWTIGHTIK